MRRGCRSTRPPTSPTRSCPPGSSSRRPARRRPASGGQAYVEEHLADYDDERDRPDLDTTSRMSRHLKWGEIHPRTMLADLRGRTGKGATAYRRELAFREFYADVLFQRPDTAREYLRPEFAAMPYDEPGAAFDAWQEGRTGFPIVDAGMRQLRATGWMHNRVRMIVASFLVKDLHIEWQHGARHFMQWLVDGDLASNHARLAVGRGLRHRRGAVLPGVQPDHAGREVRPGRPLRPPLGARARRTCRPSTCTSRRRPRTGCRTATPSRSSTTRRSGSRRSPATRGSAVSQTWSSPPGSTARPAPATAASSPAPWPSGCRGTRAASSR